ncbi:unnamed protein product [Didymodactylos carnosus]|uniref:CCDC113/CCDC96 coiled-coil domain-containing protein n=2 Tax=Didymodactylos carnosus TaxID=1234261 RepID=A0A813VAD1_9BILA|nr:unnamed protein product [Didymodactylos carnosus]CAF3622540.1 unnamed protein product [Didymodactylos carnosus]
MSNHNMIEAFRFKDLSENISAIIDDYDKTIYEEQQKEDIGNVPSPILKKKMKKLNEQLTFLRAENRLLYNYLKWWCKQKIVQNQLSDLFDQSVPPTSDTQKYIPHQILKRSSRQPLTNEKKREIAEVSFKVLLAYSQKYSINSTRYIEECQDLLETNEENIIYLEIEQLALEKFIQKLHHDAKTLQKKIAAEELIEYFKDRIRYHEAMKERKSQKSVRLRFNIDGIEKSIKKVHQLVDTVTEVDFDQLHIEIQKQLRELNAKNKTLIFCKRQQSDANMNLNAKKKLKALTKIRDEIAIRNQQLTHYNELKKKMEDEILDYEKINEPLREMTVSYRVPSINDYVNLKYKQLNLHRQFAVWKRKVQIAERELRLRRTEANRYPERIIHPWKSLKNPDMRLLKIYEKLDEQRTPLSSPQKMMVLNLKDTPIKSIAI